MLLRVQVQLGVGVSGGVEMKLAAVRTAHARGMVIVAWDVVNAFFSVGRAAVQPVHEQLAVEFDGVEIRAVIDDMTAMFEPPRARDPTDSLEWEALYEKMWCFQERYLRTGPCNWPLVLVWICTHRKAVFYFPQMLRCRCTASAVLFGLSRVKDDQARKRIESILQISDNHPCRRV